MQTLGKLLSQEREAKNISLKQASAHLSIKIDQLQSLESGAWFKLPEPAFVSGFIRNYAVYLGLDPKLALALYRREFDPKKAPQTKPKFLKSNHIFLTPQKLINLLFVLIIFIFTSYLLVQYTSFLKSPKLQVYSPAGDMTTSVPAIVISGQVERETTVSVNGEFAPTDSDGNFSYQLKLEEGQNIVEIIAAKRLSPKTKVIRIVRLSR